MVGERCDSRLLLSPRWTLATPGAVIAFLGFVLAALVATGPLKIGELAFDVTTLVLACMMVLVEIRRSRSEWRLACMPSSRRWGRRAPNLSRLTNKLAARAQAECFG